MFQNFKKFQEKVLFWWQQNSKFPYTIFILGISDIHASMRSKNRFKLINKLILKTRRPTLRRETVNLCLDLHLNLHVYHFYIYSS